MEIGGNASLNERTDGDSSANEAGFADHILTTPKLGWTYFVGTEDGEPFKIGKTDKPDYRLSGLQAGNPRRLKFLVAFETTKALAAEGMLHSQLSATRLIGEWFAWSDEAADVIARLRRGCAYSLRPKGATGHVRVGNEYFQFGRKWR